MIAAAWLLAAQAALPAGPPRFEDETVVIAERAEGPQADMPAVVSVLPRAAIQRLPAETLAGVLDHVPGVNVIFGGGYGQMPMVQARGFFGGGEAEYLQLIVDGVPLADAESGLADWGGRRAADVERVEVLHGPGSALYGDTALGGVVTVSTRASRPGSQGEAGLSAASFGTVAGDAGWTGPLGGMRGSAFASAARTDGFRAHSADRNRTARASLSSAGEVPRLAFTVSASSRAREDPGPLDRAPLRADRFSSDPLFRFDLEETRRGHAAMTLRGGGATRFRATLHGGARDTRFLRTLLVAAGAGDRALRDVETRGMGLTAEGERDLGARLRLRAGTDLALDHADTGYRAVTDGGIAGGPVAAVTVTRERIGAFASGDWWVAPRLRLAGALRFDGIGDDARPSRDGRVWRSAWSPRLGATMRLGNLDAAPVSVFVQASRAFKAPTLDQLVDPRPFSDFQGGTLVISNPLLQPQRAANLEAGLTRHGARTRVTVAVYRMAVEDEIDFDPATFRYANIGSSVHGGLEADARLLEGRAVSPYLSYAWTRVRLRGPDAAGGQLKNIPEHTLRAGVTARLPAGVAAEVTGEAMAGRFLDDDGAYPLESAVLVDARVQRMFGRLRARVDATNLLGRRWEAVGYALPDFEGGAVPYVFPGMGRGVRAGLDVIF